ncbi:MAG TPA: hypothetical protein VM914_04895 [Pyrinomonadaceae bacterium]|jgi:DNA-directed RNA polymerase specialized sigma24 family protein|nr:hypothetical protein [Pyrinomonadaceae bacterium]
MLFGSTMIEVAIGIVFVYLLVSLLCSALNELIEALLKYRATYLKRGIRQLLGNKALAEQFFNHALVKPLGKRPSYISARTFSLALWNIATTEAAKAQKAAGEGRQIVEGVTQDVNSIRQLLSSLNDPTFEDLKVSLLTLIDEAETGVRNKTRVIDAARKNVEDWYDDAMDRVSGWYKRRVHIILIILGLLAAFALNIDTIQITKALLYNDTLRKSVADAAEDYVKTHPSPTPVPAAPTTAANTATNTTAANGATNAGPANNTTGPATTTGAASPTPTPDPQAAAEQQARLAKAKINEVRAELNSLGLPIGWPSEPPPVTDDKYKTIADEKARAAQHAADVASYNTDPRWPTPGPYGKFLKILGLILTGLAVSQGAPFWFDMLNKFIVIRSTVKPKEKSPDEGSKDKTDDDDDKK